MRVVIGSDHGGYELKNELAGLIRELGHELIDFGTHGPDPVDYPDFALLVGKAVVNDPDRTLGIVVDGAGCGSAITANKVPGVRAAACYCTATAKNSREHNDANVISIGTRFLSNEEVLESVLFWLEIPFSGEERHARRIEKIEFTEFEDE